IWPRRMRFWARPGVAATPRAITMPIRFIGSSVDFVDEDFAALLAATGDSHKQFAPIGSKESSPSPCRRFDPFATCIMIRILLIQDIHESTAPDYVHAASGRVVEQIVGIVDNLKRPGLLAGLGVNYQQPGRRPAAD